MYFAKSVLTEVDQMVCFEEPCCQGESKTTAVQEKVDKNGAAVSDIDDESMVSQNSLMRKMPNAHMSLAGVFFFPYSAISGAM